MSQIGLLCSTQDFEIDDSCERFQYRNFILSKNHSSELNFFEDVNFIELTGLISIKTLKKAPFFVSINTTDYFFNDPLTPNVSTLCEKSEEALRAFFNFLWFIKDNSSGTHTMHLLEHASQGTGVFLHSTNVYYSNSLGEYKSVVFTLDELNKAKIIEKKLVDLSMNIVKNEKQIQNKTLTPFGETRLGDHHFYQYNSLTRINRALMFLSIARGNSVLPLKVSFYVGIFETLFTTDSSEVAHKITERLTLYLAGDYEENDYTQ